MDSSAQDGGDFRTKPGAGRTGPGIPDGTDRRDAATHADGSKSRQADLYTTGIGDESGECSGGEPLHGEGTLDLHRKRKKSIL